MKWSHQEVWNEQNEFVDVVGDVKEGKYSCSFYRLSLPPRGACWSTQALKKDGSTDRRRQSPEGSKCKWRRRSRAEVQPCFNTNIIQQLKKHFQWYSCQSALRLSLVFETISCFYLSPDRRDSAEDSLCDHAKNLQQAPPPQTLHLYLEHKQTH